MVMEKLNKEDIRFQKTVIEPIRHLVEQKNIGVSFKDALNLLNKTEDEYRSNEFSLSADEYLTLHRWLKLHSKGEIKLKDWMSYYSATSAGLAGMAVLSSSNIKDATRIAERYLPLYLPAMKAELITTDTHARLSLKMVVDLKELNQFLLETMTGLICIIADEMTGSDIPHKIHFKHSYTKAEGGVSKLKELQELFNAEVYFDSDFNGVEGEIKYLNAQSRSPNEATLNTVTQLLDSKLVELQTTQTFSTTVVEKLNSLAKQEHFPSIEEFASQINMSSRSLVRKLANENTTFKTLSNEVKFKLAKELLKNNKLSLKQVAAKAGYNSVNSFGRAFKSLTNETPLQWKQKNKS